MKQKKTIFFSERERERERERESERKKGMGEEEGGRINCRRRCRRCRRSRRCCEGVD